MAWLMTGKKGTTELIQLGSRAVFCCSHTQALQKSFFWFSRNVFCVHLENKLAVVVREETRRGVHRIGSYLFVPFRKSLGRKAGSWTSCWKTPSFPSLNQHGHIAFLREVQGLAAELLTSLFCFPPSFPFSCTNTCLNKALLQKIELAHEYWIIESRNSIEFHFQVIFYPMLSSLQQEN